MKVTYKYASLEQRKRWKITGGVLIACQSHRDSYHLNNETTLKIIAYQSESQICIRYVWKSQV